MQRLILFFVFYPFLLNAQAKFDDTWLFGGNGGDSIAGFGGTALKFSTEPPSNTYAHLPFIIDASSVINDSVGKLLFYSNGCEIANYQHQIMKNGEGLNIGGAVYEQSCLPGYGYNTQ